MTADRVPDWLSGIRIVLIRPTEPGNIGSAARAMKTMGLHELVLVEPKEFPSARATARASGADDLLADARVVSTLEDAISDCDLVFGTSARLRDLPWPLLSPRQAAMQAWDLRDASGRIAVVFGSERSGMSNEEMDQCQFQIHIPTDETYSSLNLAASVQVVAYEFRMQYLQGSGAEVVEQAEEKIATREQMKQFYDQLYRVMEMVGYYRPEQPKLLRRRMKKLFNRPLMTHAEVQIMRGFLSMIEKTANRKK